MISHQFPALIVVTPLLMAFVVAILGWLNRAVAYYLATATLIASSVASLGVLARVLAQGPILYKLGGWMPPVGIAYYIDHLNALVLTVISLVALVNLVATKAAVQKEHPGKTTAFYSIYLLSVCGHLGMVATGDAFNLYVLLEIAALSGYSLLGMGKPRAQLSTLNYLFIGTIGASFYLLGVGYLYIHTGSLNMLDISAILAKSSPAPTVLAAFGLIMVGVMIKCACFPVHAWLPNAYSHAPSAASSLIAPMTTKVMVYVMLRMMLTVFTPDMVFGIPDLSTIMVWVGVAAILYGAGMALSSRNLKRMLAYIIVSEVGYMVGGAWLGNTMGMTGSILHIANDAVMTLTVFLAAGCITYRTGGLDFKDLQGLFKKMPFTMAAFALGAISMIGVPPTCGFFSKWYLVLGGMQAGHYGFVAALILSSLVNVVLFFRIFEIAFFEPFAENTEHGSHGGHAKAVPMAEAPWLMVTGLTVSALALLGMGLFTSQIVGVIEPIIPLSLP